MKMYLRTVGRVGRWSVLLAVLIPGFVARLEAATNLVQVLGPSASGYAFNPAVLNITVGDVVTWTNFSSMAHDVTPGTRSGENTNNPYWAPIQLALFTKASVTFSNVGVYPYICKTHVIVNPQPLGNPTQTGVVNVATFNFPPTVSVTSPTAGTALLEPATVTVTATASDQDGTITNIQLFIGANLVGEGATSPLSATLNGIPGGNYTVTAKAFDNRGGTTVSTPVPLVVRYRVDYFDVAYFPTSLKIKPGESVLFTNRGGSHTVSGTGAEPYCGSAPVPIEQCVTTLNTAGTFPYQCVFHVAFGMTGAVSVVSSFNRPPLATLRSPASNSVFIAPANFVLQAGVFDPDGNATSVQFFNGAALLGTDTTQPFSFAVTNLPPGNYSYRVLAGDNLGSRGTSAPVNITVVAPIQLSAPALGPGGFQFRYTATPGSKYVIEGSAGETAPEPFVPLGTNQAAATVESFLDPGAVTRSNRMYRVFQQP
jgi:plastocyanin